MVNLHTKKQTNKEKNAEDEKNSTVEHYCEDLRDHQLCAGDAKKVLEDVFILTGGLWTGT